MKAALWTAFLLTLLVLWCREVLHFGAARREKADFKRDERRLRRRSLGLFVLLLLGGLYELSSVMPFASALHELVYYANFFIVLIWLLIIAARDVADIAESYVEERQQSTLQALVDLERKVRPATAEADRPIPNLDFSGSTDPGEPGGSA
jgi:hypothetical protein